MEVRDDTNSIGARISFTREVDIGGSTLQFSTVVNEPRKTHDNQASLGAVIAMLREDEDDEDDFALLSKEWRSSKGAADERSIATLKHRARLVVETRARNVPETANASARKEGNNPKKRIHIHARMTTSGFAPKKARVCKISNRKS